MTAPIYFCRCLRSLVTVLLVEKYLDLLLLVGLETGIDSSDGLPVRQFAGHERTVRSSLHDFLDGFFSLNTGPKRGLGAPALKW